MGTGGAVANDVATARLFRLSIGVFFVGGFLTSIVSLLVPRLQLLFDLGYARALLVQLAFHSSYLLFALPIAAVIVRAGYMRSIATGLAVMVAGCIGFIHAHQAIDFVLVLAALLLLSVGITFLQIASNAVVTIAGPSEHAAARLTLLQGFNSLGTVAGPLLCAQFLLPGSDGRFMGGGTGAIVLPFALSGIVLAVLGVAFAIHRDMLGRPVRADGERRYLALFRRERRLRTGTAAMFAYVGAEVTIGTLLTGYLMLPQTIAAAPVTAGRMVSLYWGGAMAGRFIGAFLMRRFSPRTMLTGVAIGATLLTLVGALVGALGGGAIGAVALLAIGLCNAIMYPTIYALALPEDTRAAPIASMFLCMAVVGGAVIPFLTGVIADAAGLGLSLLLPAACYLGIAAFARAAR